MKEIKLASGLTLSIDEGIMDDMEILDALAELEEGNGAAISKLCIRLLGADEKKKLYDHLRENGRVKVTSVTAAITEIFQKLGEPGKN